MRGSLKRVTAPDASPITLARAKAHLRVDTDDDDDLIKIYINAATESVDGPRGFLGRALMEQTWDYFLDGFPCGAIELPLPPLRSVLGVYYNGGSGTEQTVSPSSYMVSTANEPGRVYIPGGGSWPSLTYNYLPDNVRIRFVAGYEDDEVPVAIQNAILIRIDDLYNNRGSQIVGESATELSWSAQQLLRPHRFYLGMA